MEKGNAEGAAGAPVAEAEDGKGGGTQPREAAKEVGPPGTEPAPTPVQGSGGSQADQTRERNPWSAPNLGETTLPDGTKVRRDANGDMFRRHPGSDHEYRWDPEQRAWEDTKTRKTGDWETEGWGDPAPEWHEAWGGEPLPESWQSVPRTGSTEVPEGKLSRDAADNYRLKTPSGEYQWNEQSGQWYDSQTGREAPPGLSDPVDDWRSGNDADAQTDWEREGPRPTWRQPAPGWGSDAPPQP